jgi:pimeloyl-ACP methyl ester carboxylesterase
VVAQVPHVDGLASALRFPLQQVPHAAWLAARDVVSTALGGQPVRVPIVSRSGICCLAGADCYDGYHRLVPADAQPQREVREVPARILLGVIGYRPIREVHRIAAPVLIVAARRDSLIPFASIEKAARRIARARLEAFDGGHFEPYFDPLFAGNVALQRAFLLDRLRP